MPEPYLCPNCKTNRTRFNLIEQVAKSVKVDPQSGEIVEELTSDTIAPYHIVYRGPTYKVQCGACGLIEDEQTYIKRAEHSKRI